MPTVEKVWRQCLPPGSEVVAGEAGLYREVSWVVTLKPTPPGFESLRGEEIALISPRVALLLNAPLPRLVSSFAERGGSAIALLGDAPAPAVDRAQSLELPLLQLPPQTHLTSLEQKIVRLINQERLSLYHREQELSRLLMDLALRGRGVAAIAEKLVELTGKGLAVVDRGFAPGFYLPHPHPHHPLSGEEVFRLLAEAKPEALSRLKPLPLSAAEPPVAGLALTAELSCFISPVIAAQGVSGYLCLVSPRGELDEADRLAARHGAVALAIEMTRLQAVEETEDRLQADLVDSLLSGDFPSAQVIRERGRRLGWDLSLPYTVIVIDIAGDSLSREAVRRGVAAVEPGALCHFRGESLLVLCPVPEKATPHRLKARGEALAREVAAQVGAAVSAGIGRSYPAPEGVRASYQEAAEALAMGRQLFGPGSFTYFGDLGVYRLLFALRSSGELESFYRENLGRLSDYDRRRGGELLKTLDALCRYGSLTQAAAALHIHRNTLLYRLRRIQELSGLDLEEGESRLRLYLALKAAETLSAPAQ